MEISRKTVYRKNLLFPTIRKLIFCQVNPIISNFLLVQQNKEITFLLQHNMFSVLYWKEEEYLIEMKSSLQIYILKLSVHFSGALKSYLNVNWILNAWRRSGETVLLLQTWGENVGWSARGENVHIFRECKVLNRKKLLFRLHKTFFGNFLNFNSLKLIFSDFLALQIF